MVEWSGSTASCTNAFSLALTHNGLKKHRFRKGRQPLLGQLRNSAAQRANIIVGTPLHYPRRGSFSAQSCISQLKLCSKNKEGGKNKKTKPRGVHLAGRGQSFKALIRSPGRTTAQHEVTSAESSGIYLFFSFYFFPAGRCSFSCLEIVVLVCFPPTCTESSATAWPGPARLFMHVWPAGCAVSIAGLLFSPLEVSK